MPSLASKLLGAVLLLFGCLYLFAVAPAAIRQSAEWSRRSTPVRALVIRNEWSDTTSSVCAYWFHYRFALAGDSITGRRIARPDQPFVCEDVRSVMARYPVGSLVPAYHLLGDAAQQAFVLNKRELQDPFVLAVPLALIAAAFGAGLMLPGVFAGAAPAPKRAGRWYVLRDNGSLALRAHTSTAGMAAFWIGWAVSFGIDAKHWGFDAAIFGDWFGEMLFAGSLTATAFAWARIRALVDDPVVAVDRWPLVRGQPVTVRVAIPMRQRVVLEYTSVGIMCRRVSNRSRERDEGTAFHVPLGATDVPSEDGATHRFETTFTLPTPPDVTVAPRRSYHWFVVLHLDPDGAPGRELEYRVEVT